MTKVKWTALDVIRLFSMDKKLMTQVVTDQARPRMQETVLRSVFTKTETCKSYFL